MATSDGGQASEIPPDAAAELSREADAIASYIADNSEACEADTECGTPAGIDFPGDMQARILRALQMAYEMGREDGT